MNQREAKRIVCHAVARDLGIWIEEGLGGLVNDVLDPDFKPDPDDDERLVDAALELAGELTRRAGGDRARSVRREFEGQTSVDDFLSGNGELEPVSRPVETIRSDKL